MSEAEREGSPGMLNGWKEIAGFLGKSVRSVQRWERDLGLPVRRINTPDHGQIVYASRSEIEQWRQGMDRRAVSLEEIEPPRSVETPQTETLAPVQSPAAEEDERPTVARTPPWLVIAAGVAATLALGVLIGRWSTGATLPVDRVEFSGTALVARDRGGAARWTHEFAEPVAWPEGSPSGATFVDLDRDGTVEIIVPVRYGQTLQGRTRSDEVVCFRQDGTIVWRASPKFQLAQGDRVLAGPWLFRSLESPGPSANGRSWVAFSQKTSPALVLEVDVSGAERVRFVQDGAITNLAFWPTGRGEMLAVGGVHARDERAAVALMTVDGAPAQAPTAPDRLLRCTACPVDPPPGYFELPPSEVAIAEGRLFSEVSDLTSTEEGLRVSTDDHQVGLIAPGLEFEALDYTDDHWTAHRILEEHQKIDHPAQKCREQSRPRELRSWHAGTGWITERVGGR